MTLIELDYKPARARRRIDAHAASTYLALGYLPAAADTVNANPTLVSNEDQLIDALSEALPTGDVGLLLGGGADSAILAALLPPDTPCYSVAFDAPGIVDRSRVAAEQAVHWGNPHLAIHIAWSDYLSHVNTLSARKDAPLHAMEVPLYLASQVAVADGITTLVVGTGANAIFGGYRDLLARDWTFDEFVARYSHVDASNFLTDTADVTELFERHRVGHEIDTARFLREVHAPGVAAAHHNAIHAAGADMVAPYLGLAPGLPIDLGRIRAGEAAPILADAYRAIYDVDETPADEFSMGPMDVWLKGWAGPRPRPGLRDDLTAALGAASGSQRWLLWSLAAHLDLVDRAPSIPLLSLDD